MLALITIIIPNGGVPLGNSTIMFLPIVIRLPKGADARNPASLLHGRLPFFLELQIHSVSNYLSIPKGSDTFGEFKIHLF